VTSSITRVQLFSTCLVDQFYPSVAEAVVRLLEKSGITVEVPRSLTCCGQPAFNGGFRAEARAMARHTLDILAGNDAPIVVPSGSCADMVIHRYPELLADDPAYAEKARSVAARTHELCQFLVDVLGVTEVGASGRGTVAYHSSCHTQRGLGVRAQPLRLLERVEGVECRPLPETEACCGFGGLFAVKMGDISGAILNRKIADIEASGAEVVVGTDVSCLMHIGGGLHRRASKVRVAHVAEILAPAVKP
jgi:L-lactate dehydrogenase complex protein LldE